MKNLYFKFLFLIPFFAVAQQQNVTSTVSPSPFEENQSITLTFNGNSINEATWGVSENALYLWAWSFDINNQNIEESPSNGIWTNSNEANKLNYNAGSDTYSISFTPTTFYNRTGIGRIGFLIKAKNGNGDKKSQDILLNVGSFQVTLTTPEQNSTTIISSGGSLPITASNSGGNANYKLIANNTSINTSDNISNYSFTHTNITSNQNYKLEVTKGSKTITKQFSVIVNPITASETLPSGMIDGINYHASDNTKATLVLDAPNKDFVYVAGSFNNYQPNSSYAMKKDPVSGKFWLEITGLASGQIHTYQYWVVDQTPIANSPKMVKTADPYSTLVLSPFDDPYIPTSSYPNLPAYPIDQEREVSVLETGKAPYNWQVTNFSKPKKEDLIIYEVLIRDFDSNRNIQDLIDKIDYFKNLNINAIQLMPIMEFEGNESWGYNTSFHMALDKFYGTEQKFKEFIDLCHQNGIAVILDVALNHAFGRNPLVRMWMNDPDGDGWGEPSSENPFLNQQARHSYSVGNDFDHSSALTKYYTKRVVEHWIKEFKIDGFRWDLTKGFTQLCTSNDDACTNGTPSDRFGILTEYADYSWSLDPTHYVIFEHLGSNSEEKSWADYRLTGEADGIAKGIMLWGKMTDPYTELSKGFAAQGNLSGVGHKSRNFNAKRLVGYAESHDEERVMYRTQTEGNTTLQNARLLPSALIRASSVAATLITVPGPKMIWHFGELGMNNSIFTCNNGTINLPGDADGQGDCKLDTKPQPQWAENWTNDANRSQVYKDYARLNELKINEPVFEGDYAISPDGNNLKQRIYVFNDALADSALKNVVVLANFSVADLTIVPDFPYTGNWFDLMDETGNTVITVSNTAAPITIAAGQFKIFGNQAATLSTTSVDVENSFTIYPNPVNNSFRINKYFNVLDIYDITGKHIRSLKGSFTTSDSFDVSDLDQSMYLIKIEHSNGQVSTSKLIKL